MAFITKEEVKTIREEIKKAFPAKEGWKFSIRGGNSSSLDVAIVAAPIDFVIYDFDGYSHDPEVPRSAYEAKARNMTKVQKKGSVNRYHYQDQYTPETVKVHEKIIKICNRKNYDNSDIQSDYFDCGYYFNLRIGKDYATEIVNTAKKEEV
jgi:hypothetical protein